MTVISFTGPDQDGDYKVNVDGNEGLGSYNPEASYLYLDFGCISEEIQKEIEKKFGALPKNVDHEVVS